MCMSHSVFLILDKYPYGVYYKNIPRGGILKTGGIELWKTGKNVVVIK